MMFDDEECYQLFIAMDDRARMFRGANPEVNALREKLLPLVRQSRVMGTPEPMPVRLIPVRLPGPLLLMVLAPETWSNDSLNMFIP